MSLIVDTVHTYLPPKRKATPSGWISFNAPCCHHNGTGMDKRQRGGIHFGEGDSVSYHCFNCGFKASWQPGRPLSVKLKKLLQWFNVPDEEITKCAFESLRLKDETPLHTHTALKPVFFDRALPRGSQLISEWVKDPPEELIPVLEYLQSRGFYIDDYPWYWSDEEGMNNRLIIPFYYESRIVGYTARLIRESKQVKYLSEQQPGYVFNLDRQQNRKFVAVCEGPIDAISIDGIAVMSNEISPQQRYLISQLGILPVIVPDRDRAGEKLVEQILEWEGWAVSYPNWDPDIKDVNDAVKKYGKLYTLYTIAQNIQETKLKIELGKKKWFKGA
jgi:hypothetical protein